MNRQNLPGSLRSMHSRVINLRSGGPSGFTAYGWLLDYLDWTSEAVRMLGNQISPTDFDQLVLTKGYERLLSGVGNWDGIATELQRAVNGKVSTEVEQRVIEHQDKLEVADFNALRLDIQGTRVHVLVPIIVVDELDRLKEAGRTKQAKWRAIYSTAVLDRVLQLPANPAPA